MGKGGVGVGGVRAWRRGGEERSGRPSVPGFGKRRFGTSTASQRDIIGCGSMETSVVYGCSCARGGLSWMAGQGASDLSRENGDGFERGINQLNRNSVVENDHSLCFSV